MTYEFYKILHIVAIFVLLSVSAVIYMLAGRRDIVFSGRSRFMGILGVCLILILVSGFGMLARLGLTTTMPLWVIGKIAIWLTIGILPAFARRFQRYAYSIWFMTLVLASFAVALAIYHPT